MRTFHRRPAADQKGTRPTLSLSVLAPPLPSPVSLWDSEIICRILPCRQPAVKLASFISRPGPTAQNVPLTSSRLLGSKKSSGRGGSTEGTSLAICVKSRAKSSERSSTCDDDASPPNAPNAKARSDFSPKVAFLQRDCIGAERSYSRGQVNIASSGMLKLFSYSKSKRLSRADC